MASVHLLSAAPASEGGIGFHDLNLMRASAAADRFRVHRLEEDPARAELIVFVETHWEAGRYFERVRRHPLRREFAAKSYLFSAVDKVIPFLPGVFASIEARRYRPAWTRAGHYVDVREHDALRPAPRREPRLLFSFLGAGVTHPLRSRLLRLRHPDALLLDTSAQSLAIEERASSPELQAEWRGRYAQSILDSAFVLCPRGGGPSSRRLFEAMMLGRVPVILADGWVAPGGPDWPRFSIRVPERELEAVPALLERRAGEAPEMGALARAAWLEWFSPEASFHRTVEWCLELADRAAERAGLRRFEPHLELLHPYHGARALAKRLGHGAAHGSPYWDTPLSRLRHTLPGLRRRA